MKIGEQVLSGTGKKVSVTVENAEQYLYLLILFDVTGGTYTQLQWPGTSNISLLNNSREPLGQCGGIIKALLLPNGGVFIWCAIEGACGNPYGDEQIWRSDAANSGISRWIFWAETATTKKQKLCSLGAACTSTDCGSEGQNKAPLIRAGVLLISIGNPIFDGGN